MTPLRSNFFRRFRTSTRKSSTTDSLTTCAHFRPSIIIPVWKEPIPGWTDNINGPTGLLIGAGKGVIRTMYCDKDSYADYLPVDIAINAILLSSWNFLYFNDHEKRVYNLTSSSEFQVHGLSL